jgi:hypothetical protein
MDKRAPPLADVRERLLRVSAGLQDPGEPAVGRP